jgi:hypothetical protein
MTPRKKVQFNKGKARLLVLHLFHLYINQYNSRAKHCAPKNACTSKHKPKHIMKKRHETVILLLPWRELSERSSDVSRVKLAIEIGMLP